MKTIGNLLCKYNMHKWVQTGVEDGPGCIRKGHTEFGIFGEPMHATDSYKCQRSGCRFTKFECNYFTRHLDARPIV